MAKENVKAQGNEEVQGVANVPVSEDANVRIEVGETNNFKVKRKIFVGRDNKEFWTYYVEGDVIRVKNGVRKEQHVTVDFLAKDQGGYEALDIIFWFVDEADLVMREETMTNDRTGEVTKYTVYEIEDFDDNGNRTAYKVKPSRDSDKALLQMLINSRKYGGDVAQQG